MVLGSLSSGSVAQGVQTNFIANCPVDGSNHEITLGIYGSTYALQVNQSPSVQLPVSLYLEAEDSTSHKVTISLDSGVYGLSVAQANSVVAPIFFALAAETHPSIVNLTTNFGGYTFLLINENYNRHSGALIGLAGLPRTKRRSYRCDRECHPFSVEQRS
jgi:hypothetical protein